MDFQVRILVSPYNKFLFTCILPTIENNETHRTIDKGEELTANATEDEVHSAEVWEALYVFQAILCYTLMVLNMTVDNKKLLRAMIRIKKDKNIQSPLLVCAHALVSTSYCPHKYDPFHRLSLTSLCSW